MFCTSGNDASFSWLVMLRQCAMHTAMHTAGGVRQRIDFL